MAGYLALANALALVLFMLRRADAGPREWTGAEMRGLFLAMMGGWPGALIGRLIFGRREEPRGYGALLGLSVLFVPGILALPYLLTQTPGWVGSAVATYSAYHAQSSADDQSDASGIVASLDNPSVAAISSASGEAVLAVEGATQTPARQATMPKRFGPTAKPRRGAASVGKFLSVGN